MKKSILITATIVSALLLSSGCASLSMRNSDEEIQVKWEKFKAIKPFPYVPIGMVTIDLANKAACDLSQQVCDEVIVPYVELDQEGLISVYAQFTEEVEEAQQENGQLSKEQAVHQVLTLWTQRYGAGNVERLKRAIPLIQNMQAGNQITRATARLLPETVALAVTLKGGIAQIKRESKDAIGIIKMSAATWQLANRLEQLGWAMHFLDVLKEDEAVETKAIAEYVESFQSKQV